MAQSLGPKKTRQVYMSYHATPRLTSAWYLGLYSLHPSRISFVLTTIEREQVFPIHPIDLVAVLGAERGQVLCRGTFSHVNLSDAGA